jgi:DNA-binding MarR family transcriptional regulator
MSPAEITTTLVEDVVAVRRRFFRILRARALSTLLDLDLSLRELQALVLLAQLETAFILTVAQRLGVTRPVASVLVDGLVQRGLVTRREDQVDRRRAVVELTPEGQRLIDCLFEGGQSDIGPALEVLETPDLHALLRGLHALVAMALLSAPEPTVRGVQAAR